MPQEYDDIVNSVIDEVATKKKTPPKKGGFTQEQLQREINRLMTPRHRYLDPTFPRDTFDDTETRQNRNRRVLKKNEEIENTQIPQLIPRHRNDNNPAAQYPNASANEAGMPIENLAVMPKNIPKYPMMVIPPSGGAMSNPSLNSLMQFYMDQDI